MSEFINEHNIANEERKSDQVPSGIIEINTNDGGAIQVSEVIWGCYFPEEQKRIELPKVASLLLFKLLIGDLNDQNIIEWVKQQVKSMFNNNLTQFEDALTAISAWLEQAG